MYKMQLLRPVLDHSPAVPPLPLYPQALIRAKGRAKDLEPLVKQLQQQVIGILHREGQEIQRLSVRELQVSPNGGRYIVCSSLSYPPDRIGER
jgi:hypothetical protein